ncbi:MAG: 30S ribosomal protein S9 [Parcubacteria group bacterium GW2011_GWE2_38_18]|nr:MAG: 30S ribosomal protein S9 [Parcubacteria group bacterium GW2011_GWE2_38_18]
MTTATKTKTESKKTAEEPKFKGRFISATGKRKSAIAQVRLYKNGEGLVLVNQMTADDYLTPALATIATTSLRLTGHTKDLNFSIIVNGGGKKGQADAIRHGISKALLELEETLRPSMKAKGLLTRDARIKERKKPGLKKARKAPQWAKR